MKSLALLLPLLVLPLACSSTDLDQPSYAPPRDDFPAARPAAGGLEFLPPAQWWRQPLLADAVKLTGDQIAALDKIDQSQEIDRMDRDTGVAVRELRELLDSSQPAANDIVASGQRLRALRDTMFDRQLKMLADERAVLTQPQWQTLQTQLQERRTRRNQENYPRRGGRGMGGGRGRWPGF